MHAERWHYNNNYYYCFSSMIKIFLISACVRAYTTTAHTCAQNSAQKCQIIFKWEYNYFTCKPMPGGNYLWAGVLNGNCSEKRVPTSPQVRVQVFSLSNSIALFIEPSLSWELHSCVTSYFGLIVCPNNRFYRVCTVKNSNNNNDMAKNYHKYWDK